MMYFTSKSHNGSVNRAGMDGSHQVPLVTGLNSPNRITIHFQNSRLYWTCGEDEIQSSSMQGTDVQTVVRHPGGSHTWGIGVSSDRIYWTDFTTMKIGSCTKTGQDVQILHTGTCHLGSLAIVPRWNLPTNRTNHCKNRACSKVCVLTHSHQLHSAACPDCDCDCWCWYLFGCHSLVYPYALRKCHF